MKPHQSRLKYSELLQSFCLLAFNLDLDAVVEAGVGGVEESAEWSWLSEYCDAMRALRALTAVHPTAEKRRRGNAVLRRTMSKYMANRGERKDPVFNRRSEQEEVSSSSSGSRDGIN